jgi:hypothetical protein
MSTIPYYCLLMRNEFEGCDGKRPELTYGTRPVFTIYYYIIHLYLYIFITLFVCVYIFIILILLC